MYVFGMDINISTATSRKRTCILSQMPCIGSPKEAQQSLEDARPYQENLRTGPGPRPMAGGHPGDEGQQRQEGLR